MPVTRHDRRTVGHLRSSDSTMAGPDCPFALGGEILRFDSGCDQRLRRTEMVVDNSHDTASIPTEQLKCCSESHVARRRRHLLRSRGLFSFNSGSQKALATTDRQLRSERRHSLRKSSSKTLTAGQGLLVPILTGRPAPPQRRAVHSLIRRRSDGPRGRCSESDPIAHCFSRTIRLFTAPSPLQRAAGYGIHRT
jgi:hypothetical protein